MDHAFAILAGTSSVDLPRHAQLLRALPQAKGGLSTPRIADVSPYAYSASLLQACSSLQTRAPDLAILLASRAIHLQPEFEASREVAPAFHVETPSSSEPRTFLPRPWATPADITPGTQEEAAASGPETPRQRELTATLHQANETELARILHGEPAPRALLRSNAYKGSAAQIISARSRVHRPSARATQVALASRLL
jgi:hypothetical protein